MIKVKYGNLSSNSGSGLAQQLHMIYIYQVIQIDEKKHSYLNESFNTSFDSQISYYTAVDDESVPLQFMTKIFVSYKRL